MNFDLILGLQSGLILDHFDLGVIRFDYDFDWKSLGLGPGIGLEVASGFNRILTWESFDL